MPGEEGHAPHLSCPAPSGALEPFPGARPVPAPLPRASGVITRTLARCQAGRAARGPLAGLSPSTRSRLPVSRAEHLPAVKGHQGVTGMFGPAETARVWSRGM